MDVRDFLHHASEDRAGCSAHPSGRDGIDPSRGPDTLRRLSMGCHEMDELPVVAKDMTELSFAKFCGTLRNGVEHRSDIGGRAADDAEQVAGRSLVVERLLQFALARLLRLKETRVLDGDDGLVGEGLEQVDVSVGERADLGALDEDRSYCLLTTN